MILFVHSTNKNGLKKDIIPGMPLAVRYNIELNYYRLTDKTDLWRITRPGVIDGKQVHQSKWTVFESNHSAFEPLAFASTQPINFGDKNVVPLLIDKGFDGIRRVFFGNDLRFWLHGPVLIDAISYLSQGKLSLSLERYIQVDIDDIFYAETGLKMTDSDAEKDVNDRSFKEIKFNMIMGLEKNFTYDDNTFQREEVNALLEAQNKFREYAEGFTFYLGFSGSFYQTGNSKEKAGDEKLIEYKDKFLWFGHTWGHTHAHELSKEQLEHSMRLNYKFAKKHGIPIRYQYSIAPWHDGVFPVHEPLYEAWKNVWAIKVTSTEEYPRPHPNRQRRGFIHRDIMVLPRRVCDVYTSTVFLDKYPGGKSRLDKSIKGGSLFRTILTTPINIFMTHIQNYANDRLALYTLESVFNFIKCWTNLKLKQVSPYEAGRKYFEIFPEDKNPLWMNPCLDKRHLKRWPAYKYCKKLPNLLLVGPQKTDFFPNTSKTTDFIFEKSATYFHDELTPKRAFALLPNAKIISIVIHPAKRAYSWYHHMRAHNDPVAMTYSFLEVIKASDSAPYKLRQLRDHSLNPGIYVKHLSKWLEYYPSKQLFIVDGGKLKSNPVVVMNDIQKFLHIKPYVNYSRYIRFDSKRGFFCQIIKDNKTKCLSEGKGRLYPPMEKEAMDYLRVFYRHHNAQLFEFLKKHEYTVPEWLVSEQE
ncbi:hypothetical protein KUTeg_001524, partial [Tegillarca granosa]